MGSVAHSGLCRRMGSVAYRPRTCRRVGRDGGCCAHLFVALRNSSRRRRRPGLPSLSTGLPGPYIATGRCPASSTALLLRSILFGRRGWPRFALGIWRPGPRGTPSHVGFLYVIVIGRIILDVVLSNDTIGIHTFTYGYVLVRPCGTSTLQTQFGKL